MKHLADTPDKVKKKRALSTFPSTNQEYNSSPPLFSFPLGWNQGGWFRGTPFRSPLQGGLKGLGARGGGGRRSEGRRGLHLRKASRRLEEGFKGAWRGLQAFSVEGGFEGGWRGLEGGFIFKGASRGLEGGLKPSAWRKLEGGFKGAWRGLHLEGCLKGAWRGLEAFIARRELQGCLKEASSVVGCCRFGHA